MADDARAAPVHRTAPAAHHQHHHGGQQDRVVWCVLSLDINTYTQKKSTNIIYVCVCVCVLNGIRLLHFSLSFFLISLTCLFFPKHFFNSEKRLTWRKNICDSVRRQRAVFCGERGQAGCWRRCHVHVSGVWILQILYFTQEEKEKYLATQTFYFSFLHNSSALYTHTHTHTHTHTPTPTHIQDEAQGIVWSGGAGGQVIQWDPLTRTRIEPVWAISLMFFFFVVFISWFVWSVWLVGIRNGRPGRSVGPAHSHSHWTGLYYFFQAFLFLLLFVLFSFFIWMVCLVFALFLCFLFCCPFCYVFCFVFICWFVWSEFG